MKVKATQPGYYGNELKKEGDVFHIDGQQAFSEKWMEKVVEAPKERPKSSRRQPDSQ